MAPEVATLWFVRKLLPADKTLLQCIGKQVPPPNAGFQMPTTMRSKCAFLRSADVCRPASAAGSVFY